MFDRCFVINLARRPERWEQFMHCLPADWPAEFPRPERYEAVDGSKTGFPEGYLAKAGGWGCYRTHLRIWEDALCNGWKSVLVFEDDAIFAEPFRVKWQEFLEDIPDDWHQLYLGGQHLETGREGMVPVKVSDHCIRIRNCNRTHAYGIRQPFIEAAYRSLVSLPSLPLENKHHVDHRLGEMHATGEWNIYAPWRFIVGQRSGQSDVQIRRRDNRAFPRMQGELWWNQFPIADPIPEAVPC